ncbi:aliphatic sulfonate ABC transporter substrate-binding protein [Planococcus shenhongbingii]|uniref:Aliphatic sulfonate ABC transporter substrate-binding protein n=1 Tax=Planococcus shenhongbingii TaxID=3058398 RepID=A0ABT8NCI6_9BACL|nr:MULTISPECIES: aliphatic sulfonate ABC transporter substrate-binding protein [unclassified Planococcus (in: firmicutes)]MDN7245608.1 aliphatic sulfonate ABC transporter substrate-binding protein [Planococcus sp. N017]WKA60277.1 aliphatic sulfonate ABC transporter substrate-binding protein [Planococcus sp. N016]
MKKIIAVVLLLVGASFILGACSNAQGKEQGALKKVVLDYAYYSPTSLALKEFGWAEEVFEKEGIEVEWVLSQGSNKALEFLNSKSVDFGSTAGAAALIAKSNGSPIESVYIYSKPEWTALVATEDSPIKTVEDLKGKKVAATLGTDPYIFLLRSLQEAGLSSKDLEIVNLQHADGANALLTGQVDAWAGLDPHMARVEVDSGANLFSRDHDKNTYGTLNVRSEFAEQNPEAVEKVIEVYEKARKWVVENPDEAAEILAKEADMELEVAKKSIERNDFSDPIPGDKQIEALEEAGAVLKSENVIKGDADIEKTVSELIIDRFAKKVIATE